MYVVVDLSVPLPLYLVIDARKLNCSHFHMEKEENEGERGREREGEGGRGKEREGEGGREREGGRGREREGEGGLILEV